MWDRFRAAALVVYGIFKEAGQSYGADRLNRMAAAVAYRTIFALAPLLIVAVAVFGLIVGNSTQAQETLLAAIERIAGTEVADAVATLVLSAVASSDVTAVVGFILFAWTASSLFIELQNNLNDIFRVPYAATAGLGGFMRKRALSLAWALSLGIVLAALWVVGLGLTWLRSLFPNGLEGLDSLIGLGARIVSIALIPLVFALVFKTMTRASVKWRAIVPGSLFTSFAFLLAATATSAYFSWETTPAASQIAGALFVILLLAYVLSSVFLFGAQVTRVYNDHLAADPSPKPTVGNNL